MGQATGVNTRGFADGDCEGHLDGDPLGFLVGAIVGVTEGVFDGALVGDAEQYLHAGAPATHAFGHRICSGQNWHPEHI